MCHEWVASSKEMVHMVSPGLFVKFLFGEFVIFVDIWDLTKCDLYDSPVGKFSTYARGGAPVCRTPCVTLGQKLEQECQHDFLLRDHDVAKARIGGVALHLRLREHS